MIKFRMKYDTNDNTVAELYKCRYDGEIDINEKEVDKIYFLSINKIKTLLSTSEAKFASWTRELPN